MSSVAIVAYLALFLGVGALFLLVNLLVGKFLRPKNPTPEKLEIYECGEPTIGSSFVQFDLRFYVVALLFIIFDVEVALFFPWATVFGKATHMMDPRLPKQTVVSVETPVSTLTPAAANLYQELGVRDPGRSIRNASGLVDSASIESSAAQLAWLAFLDILVFFGVLMVGFFYVWKRGDLDWVRAVSGDQTVHQERAPPSIVVEEEPALVG